MRIGNVIFMKFKYRYWFSNFSVEHFARIANNAVCVASTDKRPLKIETLKFWRTYQEYWRRGSISSLQLFKIHLDLFTVTPFLAFETVFSVNLRSCLGKHTSMFSLSHLQHFDCLYNRFSLLRIWKLFMDRLLWMQCATERSEKFKIQMHLSFYHFHVSCFHVMKLVKHGRQFNLQKLIRWSL